MDYSNELIENVRNAGALGYTLEDIKYAFKVPDWKKFEVDFKTNGTIIFETYKSGAGHIQFEMEKSLIAGAKAGDKDSIELLDKLQNKKLVLRDRDTTLE